MARPRSRSPFATGMVEAAAAVPAMTATFLAFGASVAAAGLPLLWAVLATAGVYGVAGQLVLLSGGGVAGSAAANARFLPMAASLAPWFGPGPRRWWALPFVAITPWALAMRRLPDLAPASRLPWFLGVALVCWGTATAGSAAGHALADRLPPALLPPLLLANPLYFALLIADGARRPASRRAVLAGAASAPLALLLPTALGLAAAAIVGGTAAWWWGRRGGA